MTGIARGHQQNDHDAENSQPLGHPPPVERHLLGQRGRTLRIHRDRPVKITLAEIITDGVSRGHRDDHRRQGKEHILPEVEFADFADQHVLGVSDNGRGTADVGGNLWEHERDHVFTGNYNGEFTLNKDEVSEIRYISMEDLDREMNENPENFTQWFKIILEEYKHHL
ncbi:MAG: NUDIX domain-containing protein [Flavobacteriales bacterium]|nr:NUDIX domain-containing protein [Flavobacteriales bacterium]